MNPKTPVSKSGFSFLLQVDRWPGSWRVWLFVCLGPLCSHCLSVSLSFCLSLSVCLSGYVSVCPKHSETNLDPSPPPFPCFSLSPLFAGCNVELFRCLWRFRRAQGRFVVVSVAKYSFALPAEQPDNRLISFPGPTLSRGACRAVLCKTVQSNARWPRASVIPAKPMPTRQAGRILRPSRTLFVAYCSELPTISKLP